MLVVLAVLGLTVGLVVVRGPLRSAGLDARTAASVLAGTLRAARSEAIARDQPVTVTVAGSTVRVGAAPPHALSAILQSAHPITFAPDGTSGGGRIGVAAGPVRKVVAVDWLTGRVSIADAS